jgi:hypothetical protein
VSYLTRLGLALALGMISTTAWAGATASAFKKETKKGANYWNASSAIDGKLETCWMVPGESDNKGEWIMIEVPKSSLDKVGLVVGWAQSEAEFKDYPRVKAMKVETLGENDAVLGTAELTFDDKMEMQIKDVPELKIGSEMFGGKVRLTVTDFYEGSDYPNLGVSEVLLFLTEFDAQPVIKSVSGESAGKSKDMMLDKNAKTFWAAPAEGASISFEAAGFSLAKVGITPGPKDYARPKKVEITANSRTIVKELPDATTQQWIDIPAVMGYTGSAWGTIEMKILETWPGTKVPGEVGISEINLKATAFEGL